VAQATHGLTEKGLQVGPDLYVRELVIAEVREQDINAQTMQPDMFDRLTENISIRGALESLPYCHQPNGEGPVSIISGHHRMRAAREAGLDRMWALVDEQEMSRSQIRAKQIAHNALAGSPDEKILAQMVGQIDNVDDLLMTGLSEDKLPTVEPDDTNLQLPHADFDFRQVVLMFLPAQLDEFKLAVEMIERKTDVVYTGDRSQFTAFSKAMLDYGRTMNVKSMATTIGILTDLARQQIEAHENESDQAEVTPSDG